MIDVPKPGQRIRDFIDFLTLLLDEVFIDTLGLLIIYFFSEPFIFCYFYLDIINIYLIHC